MRDIIIFLNGRRGLEVVKKLNVSKHVISKCIIPIEKKYDQVQIEIESMNLDCLRFENVNQLDVLNKIHNLDAKLFIIAGFSTIFKKELICLPKIGTINLHAGLLPKYRGGSPLNWQIINGESKAVISILKVDEGIDTGAILNSQEIMINDYTDINDLHFEANKLFPQMVLDTVDKIDLGNFKGVSQKNINSSYWHQRNDDDGYLDFKTLNSFQASRLVRALTTPYPGAWSFYKDKKIRIFKVEIPKFNLKGVSGRVCYIEGKGPYVVCQDKAILIKDYIIENNIQIKLKNGDYLN